MELAEVQGIGDAEMAGYLGVPRTRSKRRRRAALERLAVRLGVCRRRPAPSCRTRCHPESPTERGGATGGPRRPKDHVADPRSSAARRSRQTASQAGAPLAPAHRLPRRPALQEPGAAVRAPAHAPLAALALVFGLLTTGLGGGDPPGEEGPERTARRAPRWRRQCPGPRPCSSRRRQARPGRSRPGCCRGGGSWSLSAPACPIPATPATRCGCTTPWLEARRIGSAERGDFAVEARLPRERGALSS